MKAALIIILALGLAGCISTGSKNDLPGFPNDADYKRAGRTFVPGNTLIE